MKRMSSLIPNDDDELLHPVAQYVWIAPLATVLGTALLYFYIGVSGLIGVAILMLLIPLNFSLGSFLQSIRAKHLPVIDKRVKLTEDIIRNISVVKMFSWDVPFLESILRIRNYEMRFVYREVLAWALLIGVLILTPSLSTLAAFSFHSLQQLPMTPSSVFGALTILNWIKFPLMHFSQGLSLAIQLKIALQRIHAYLTVGVLDSPGSSPGTDKKAASVAPVTKTMNDSAVEMVRERTPETGSSLAIEPEGKESHAEDIQLLGDIGWRNETDTAVLRNVDIHIGAGELVMVIGVVGSGKSTLLTALLDEISVGSGSKLPSKAIFCSQTPFILNATVKQNILFSLDPGENESAGLKAKYEAVLRKCCLEQDLQEWTYRDQTMLGERGVTLSGGQKCRVALCRAALAAIRTPQASILLDDPLSALDLATGRSVFRNVIANGGMLGHRTRVLVTHNMQYIREADRVILVDNNRVVFNDKPHKLPLDQAERDQPTSKLGKVLAGLCAHVSTFDDPEASLERASSTATSASYKAVDADLESEKDEKLMAEEERVMNDNVAFSTVSRYFSAAGGLLFVSVFFVGITAERVAYVLVDFWLAIWTQAEFLTNSSTLDIFGADVELPADSADPMYRNVYGMLVGIVCVMVTWRLVSVASGLAHASNKLVTGMMWGLMDSPIAFFESNPLGRIMNRVSYDVEVMDFILVQSMNGSLASLWWLISALVVMLIVVPIAVVGILPALIVFLMTHQYYRRCCVELQRIDNRTRSPMMSLLEETVAGLLTIRSFHRQPVFREHMLQLVDDTCCGIYASTCSYRWLGIRVELLGIVVTMSVAIAAWLIQDALTPGLIGVALQWCFNCNVSFQFFVIMSTRAEAKLTSAERVIHYATSLDKESPRKLPEKDKAIPSEWPQHGHVELRSVVLRYRADFEPALKNVSAVFMPGERIGVVGRTGSGKSTLAKALLRLRECESGQILVDGVDIRQIGLDMVRGRQKGIVIIPQDPVVFSGTVRFNLDPFNAYSDEEIWKVLAAVRLDHVVRSTFSDDGIDEPIHGNFSVGQRQLLCLARALLRMPKVLVMDEATASVDAETDSLIQATVADAFPTSTVIEIAHRLHSVMGADKILVMDTGTVVEFGKPKTLYEDPTNSKGLRDIIEHLGVDEQNDLLALMKP